MFAVFIVFQLFNVLNCRSEKDSLFTLGLFSNKAINYAILASGFLLFLFVHYATFQLPLIGIEFGNLLSTTPLETVDWMVLIAVASTVFLIEEFRKLMMNSGFFSVRRLLRLDNVRNFEYFGRFFGLPQLHEQCWRNCRLEGPYLLHL